MFATAYTLSNRNQFIDRMNSPKFRKNLLNSMLKISSAFYVAYNFNGLNGIPYSCGGN